MGSYFSLEQWQELELQALIFRYMLAGAVVPHELLQPIKKNILHSPTSPYFIHQHYLQHYQSTASLLQPGYWGRGAMDPEPGRCRRTDGKKWRCSRDMVAGHKYCERHMHRGKNRSRKPVELPTPTTINEQCSSGGKSESKSLFETQDHVGGDGKSGGHMLRHFFDDWPRSLQQSSENGGRVNSATCLTISMPENKTLLHRMCP